MDMPDLKEIEGKLAEAQLYVAPLFKVKPAGRYRLRRDDDRTVGPFIFCDFSYDGRDMGTDTLEVFDDPAEPPPPFSTFRIGKRVGGDLYPIANPKVAQEASQLREKVVGNMCSMSSHPIRSDPFERLESVYHRLQNVVAICAGFAYLVHEEPIRPARSHPQVESEEIVKRHKVQAFKAPDDLFAQWNVTSSLLYQEYSRIAGALFDKSGEDIVGELAHLSVPDARVRILEMTGADIYDRVRLQFSHQ